uniref:Lethal giant larvae homologue 2 domain-containing protein n=1 Tax=Timema poppense TaxID=170557 RepID=A0A7R9CUZ0_TIMPO|nr:unnamed protein product [Timema poppensis]
MFNWAVVFPAKPNKEGKMETCKPIQKVEWKSSRTGEAYVIFSGGLTYDKAGRTPSITVIHGKTTTVLEMDNNVVDFVTLCESPWNSGETLSASSRGRIGSIPGQYTFAPWRGLIFKCCRDEPCLDIHSPHFPPLD